MAQNFRLILLVLTANLLCRETSQQCFIFKDVYEVMKTLTFTQKFSLTTLNLFDVCAFSRTSYYGNEHLPYREITRKLLQWKDNETPDDFDFVGYNQKLEKFSESGNFNNTIKYKWSDNLRIPLTTHRVWITGMQDPKELIDLIGNKVQDKLNSTYDYFDTSAKQIGRKWTHFLWIQDQKILPKTVRMFASFGVSVRSVYELEAMKEDRIRRQFEFYVDNGPRAVAAASDFIRAIAVYEYGGLYFDNDYMIEEWDYNINHYLDFISTRLLVTTKLIGLSNACFAAKQGHPIMENYIKIMVDLFKFYDEEDQRSHTLNSCTFRTVGSTIFGTGPAIFSAVAYNFFNQDGNQDSVINRGWEKTQYADIDVVDMFGNESGLTIKLTSSDMMSNSWRNDLKDVRVFGFPEFNEF
ncbi:UNKNOWN [Stylonychia lemnae]|uniref:Uncharacterized protein n=1 Tax=Stylonychia lemnae TaxID=5949 RepID=A0A078AZL2_STYLE|nr:UNKNOWN [Stylonychia lemnae]|eukprot:CDW86642.1 UNKNOWN [Stylonychia lemnae]